jgi:hypothetical protein
MKIFIFLILSCGSIFGADTSIQVVTTAMTNAAIGEISTKDVFIRDGKTNLMRITNIRNRDADQSEQSHIFYYDGVRVGEYTTMPGSSRFTTEAGCPYLVEHKVLSWTNVSCVLICKKDREIHGELLDYFMATNGVFLPADSSDIREANKGINPDMDLLIRTK